MLPALAGVRLARSAGPLDPMASMPGTGLRDGPVWRYDHDDAAASPALHAGFTPQPNQQFAIAIFPDLQHTPTVPDAPPPNLDGCQLGLAFDTADGVRFVTDQHGHPVDGTRQCLVPGNWNLLLLDLDALEGQSVAQVRLVAPGGLTGAGWLQVFGVEPKADEPQDAVDHVRTLRGTHSGYLYSRGNTLPQVCVPQGFNFLTPLTEARNRNWLYGWHRDGGPSPRLQGLAINHTPSPWIGDRGAFQVMPFTRTPTAEPEARAIGFHHTDEVDRPHLYSVRLADGTVCEMTATSHVGFFRFTFHTNEPHGVIIDHPRLGRLRCHDLDDGRVAFEAAIEPDGGWQTSQLGPNPPTYVYGESMTPCLSGPAKERRSRLEGLTIRGRRLTQSPLGRFKMSLPRRQAVALHSDAETIEVRVAVSFVSPEQARKNFALEAQR